MKSFEYTIQDELGLHVRPAGKLVKQASHFDSNIMLYKGGQSADCKRLIAVMALAAKQRDILRFTAEGGDEDTACEALENFCRSSPL